MAFLGGKRPPASSSSNTQGSNTAPNSAARSLVDAASRQGQPSPYSDRNSRVQNCPHCGKDINTVPTDNNPAIVQHYLDSLEDNRHNLSKWESEFVDSVNDQFESRGTLSPKQISTLRKIYEEKC